MAKNHVDIQTKIKAVNSILNKSQTVTQVAKFLCVSRSTVYAWINTTKQSKSLARNQNPLSGRQPKIFGKSAEVALGILLKPATAYGYDTDLWNTRRIASVLKKELNLTVSRMSVHRALVKLKQSYKKPEKRFIEANDKEQKEWQEKIIPEIKKVIKKHNAILYFEDEANISLTPVVGKTWGPIGQKVIKKFTGNKGSLSAISAISNDGRLIFNLHENNKRYKSPDIIDFLAQMLKHHPRRHLVVIMDNAPCHKSKSVKKFIKTQNRLHVFNLPPRTPEFNPDEKLWNHLKHQELKSHKATDLKSLFKIVKKN